MRLIHPREVDALVTTAQGESPKMGCVCIRNYQVSFGKIYLANVEIYGNLRTLGESVSKSPGAVSRSFYDAVALN